MDIALSLMPIAVQDQDIAFSFWVDGVDENQFLVTKFSGEEAIFHLPRFEVELISRSGRITADQLLDMSATLTVHHKYLGQLRHFSGIIAEAERGDSGHRHTVYKLTLLPSLYRLDHGSDCRIFQNMSVPEIVKTVLEENGVEHVTWQIEQEHLPREFLVAFHETHFRFIERILAEEGIYYYFHHGEKGALELIITDIAVDLVDCPGQRVLTYNAAASGAVKGVYCSSLSQKRQIRATRYRQRDYSFKNPPYNNEHLDGETRGTKGKKGEYELYQYPGRYKQDKVGIPFTRTKMEAVRVDADLVHGITNTPLLTPGYGTRLTGHADETLNRQWRLLAVRHEGVQPQALIEDALNETLVRSKIVAPTSTGSDQGLSSHPIQRSKNLFSGASGASQINEDDAAKNNLVACRYSCAFTAQDYQIPYRPPQAFKPHIDGPQIAHVVGPQGEEIYTDPHGRVKVHFPWDRHKNPEAEDSSCWIRVASSWAGAKWGAISIPRIGQEVIVEFLDGDPDQPIITGRVYNVVNSAPYDLPRHKTRMTIQSKTHKGEGYNELRFEDENGIEQVFLHGEKDLDIIVEHDRREWIKHTRHLLVDADKVTEVKGSDTALVAENRFIGTGEKFTVAVGGDHAIKVGEKHSLDAGESVYIKAGSAMVLEAPDITIKAPGGFIRIDGSGITIRGRAVNVNSGGTPAIGVPAAQTNALKVDKADDRKND